MLKIKFQDQEMLFVGDSLEEGGAIATQEAYRRGEASYAHLSCDGWIRRFREIIGNWEDIEVLGEIEVDPDNRIQSIINIIGHPSWEQR